MVNRSAYKSAMYSDALLKLEKNPVDVFNKAKKILLQIIENILKSPENQKVRTLPLNNEIISKIINIAGVIECLEFMGFQQSLSSFNLPMNESLKNLEIMRNELLKRILKSDVCIEVCHEISSNTNGSKRVKMENDVFKRVVLPPLVQLFSNMFLKNMEERFHKVLQHEDRDLQIRALNLLPLNQLETNAQNKLRAFQEEIKRNNKSDAPEIEIQDLMILELLNWFKHDFFEWVDCLDCEHCGGKSEIAGRSYNSDLLAYADRVEGHKCIDCGHMTYFARFNDLNILLETRRGRCGEWANTFMLFCRALKWDTRFVYDEQDHVWTEVFSHSQNRWLHCDPCETACDTPLVYETGWGKEINYVTAYSCDEVQDVTWRYTKQHSNVLKRRTMCSEVDLIDAMMRMRTIRQNFFCEARKKYLAKRCLEELVEMMVERHSSDKDSQGRISGGIAWKLSRKDIKDLKDSFYVWTFSIHDLKAKKAILNYSASLDQYELTIGNIKDVKRNWQSGIFTAEGIFRKEEKDWNMVYISNREDSTHGFVTWKFEINDISYVFDEVDIKLRYKLFENGKIYIMLTSAAQSITIQPDDLSKHRKLFCGETSMSLTATLVGGQSWQHAQLFRQNMNDEGFPFTIQFSFRKK